MDLLGNQGWIIIAFAFFGIIGYISYIRWRDKRWIAQRFGSHRVIAMSFGVNYFGKASEPGKPSKSSGFLLLLPDRIFYRSRVRGLELEIRGNKVIRVYHDKIHKGYDLHQSVIKLEFYGEKGEKDCVAFRVPYPPQWIRAIEDTLLKKAKLFHKDEEETPATSS